MVGPNVPRVLFNMEPAGMRRSVNIANLIRSVARRNGYEDVAPPLSTADDASHGEAKGATESGVSPDSEDELFAALADRAPHLIARDVPMDAVLTINEDGFRFGAEDNYRDVFIRGTVSSVFARGCYVGGTRADFV